MTVHLYWHKLKASVWSEHPPTLGKYSEPDMSWHHSFFCPCGGWRIMREENV